MDGTGSNIVVSHRTGDLLRVIPKMNDVGYCRSYGTGDGRREQSRKDVMNGIQQHSMFCAGRERGVDLGQGAFCRRRPQATASAAADGQGRRWRATVRFTNRTN